MVRLFFRGLLSALCVTVLFIAANNLPLLPREVCRVLWYGFPAAVSFVLAFLYGKTGKRSGGGVLFAAFFLLPLLLVSIRLSLPWKSTLCAPIPLVVAVVSALIGEILSLKRHHG